MDVYVSARELYELKLNSDILARSVKNILVTAKRQNWKSRPRKGRGGGFEYDVSSMPPSIQAAVMEKLAQATLRDASLLPEMALPCPVNHQVDRKSQKLGIIPAPLALSALSEAQRKMAQARLALVSYVLALHEEHGFALKAAVQYVIDCIAKGTLPEDKMRFVGMANARRGEKQQGLSFPTLYRWVRAYRSVQGEGEALRMGRLLALSAKQTRQPENLSEKTWLGDFLKYYQNPNKPSIVMAMRQLALEYAALNKTMPSYDMVIEALKRLPPSVKNRGRVSGSEYRAKYLTHVRRDWLSLSPNDVWVGDGHSFKALVRSFQNGQPKTLEFTMVIDGCSGAIMGWSVSLAENTTAVADALRAGFRDFGLPLVYYSDNGAGQTAKLLDDEVLGLFARLNIEHVTGSPGNPMGRARIERKWKDTAVALAREYATFQGKNADSETVRRRNALIQSAWNAEKQGKTLNPDQKKALKSVPTFEQFLADLKKMVETYNETHEHSALPKNPETGRHYTPLAYYRHRINEHSGSLNIERLTDLELDYLARPEVIRKVDMNAEISWLNNVYFHRDLLNFAGQTVRVGIDLHDGSNVLVRNMKGELICKAVLGGNVVPAFAKSFIEHQQEKRTERKLRDLQKRAEITQSEMRPAIEQMPDFTAIAPKKPSTQDNTDWFALLPKDEPTQTPKKRPIFNFDWEREEWEKEQQYKTG